MALTAQQIAEQRKDVEEMIAGPDVGFAKALFFGKFKTDLLYPYPTLSADKQAAAAKKMADLLETEKAGYDLGSYRDAPPGLRIWAGATIERSDLEALFPWIEWAYAQVRDDANKSAA